MGSLTSTFPAEDLANHPDNTGQEVQPKKEEGTRETREEGRKGALALWVLPLSLSAR